MSSYWRHRRDFNIVNWLSPLWIHHNIGVYLSSQCATDIPVPLFMYLFSAEIQYPVSSFHIMLCVTTPMCLINCVALDTASMWFNVCCNVHFWTTLKCARNFIPSTIPALAVVSLYYHMNRGARLLIPLWNQEPEWDPGLNPRLAQ